MTASRQRDDRTVEARTLRRIVVGAATLGLIGSTLLFARTIAESADQLRATVHGAAPRPVSSLDHEPATLAVDDHVAVSQPAFLPVTGAPTPRLEPGPEAAQEPQVAAEPALPHSGPPSAAEVAQLIDGGLVPESSAEDALALRAALEAVAP